ncbi:Ste3p Ecym_8111 [Eremothecium cymbalariae DBVPG|uniref:Pheromone a factor receptor n=2 Tax=Eremothecium cymbalariae TaxID=45285 RepID=G8JX31_ERECY|nr:Hypothetical protein Ecym_8111 [Eremothecium cymbalariae DBVPG\
MGYAQVIIALSLIALILLLPPLVWHAKTRNTPAIILIIWLLIVNVKSIIDAAIWGGEDFVSKWNGYGWCDIAIKLEMGSNVGVSCAVANIAHNLHVILKAKSVLPDASSWRKLLVDLSFCLITPILVMSLSYLVQVLRFGIFRYNGCQNMLSPTWVTTMTYTVWMFLWSLVGFIYAMLLLWVFYQKRKDVRDLLHCTNSGLNLSRFARLLIFCLVIILIMFPFSVFSFVYELKNVGGAYSFAAIHTPSMWYFIPHFDPGVPLYNIWLYIFMSYLVFLIFGLGSDALALYAKCLRSIGLGQILDKFNGYLEKNSDSRVSKLTGRFMKRQGYEQFSIGTISDSTATFSYDTRSTNSAPSNFVIDYVLPQDIKRQERRKRYGVKMEELGYGKDKSLNDLMLSVEDDLDFNGPVDCSPFADISPFTNISFSEEINAKLNTVEEEVHRSMHSGSTIADNTTHAEDIDFKSECKYKHK